MPFCIFCGVKVNDRHLNCPLCNKELEYPSTRKPLPPLYPDDVFKLAIIKSHANKRDVIKIHLLGFVTILIILLNLGIDYTINKQLTWSKISTSSIFFVFSLKFLIHYLKHNLYIFYTLSNLSLGIFLYVLDLFTPGSHWFLLFAMPCLLSLQFASCLIFVLFKKIEGGINRAITSIIITNIYLLIVNEIVPTNIRWALICTAVILPVAIFLFVINIILQKKRH